MAKTKLEKIESIQAEIQQLKNREKQLLQQHKEQERKERTHRLCKRGGLLENMMPDTVQLIDEQFKIFLEKTICSDYAQKILTDLTTRSSDSTTHNLADTEDGVV